MWVSLSTAGVGGSPALTSPKHGPGPQGFGAKRVPVAPAVALYPHLGDRV